jgi:hypothetical protein
MMNLNRQKFIYIALLLTLVASLRAAFFDRGDEVTQPVAVKYPRRISAESAGIKRADILLSWERTDIAGTPGDLFLDEQHVIGKPAVDPQPSMPVLPFVYAGKMIDQGRLIVFLTEGEKNLTVQPGEVIDQVWKVETIKPPSMTFTYLPLKTQLTLAIGEPN